MNILFLIVPFGVLAITALFSRAPRLGPGLDEKGLTLQTVIIIAVLALAATAAGIILYNTIVDRAEDVSDVNTPNLTCEFGERIQKNADGVFECKVPTP